MHLQRMKPEPVEWTQPVSFEPVQNFIKNAVVCVSPGVYRADTVTVWCAIGRWTVLRRVVSCFYQRCVAVCRGVSRCVAGCVGRGIAVSSADKAGCFGHFWRDLQIDTEGVYFDVTSSQGWETRAVGPHWKRSFLFYLNFVTYWQELTR